MVLLVCLLVCLLGCLVPQARGPGHDGGANGGRRLRPLVVRS